MAHGIVILGVTFKPADDIQSRYKTMEITIVQDRSEPPEKAQLLAQASLDGGGETEEAIVPKTTQPNPFRQQQAAMTAPPSQDAQLETKATADAAEATLETESAPDESQQKIAIETTDAKEALTQTKMDSKERTPTENTADTEKPEQTQAKKSLPEQRPLPPITNTIATLTRNLEIASLQAEIDRKLESRAQRKRKKYISATTKEHKYAAYLETWRAKVERIGNINYPQEARRQRLSGSLILNVALNADGSIEDISISRSSGNAILDGAAIRIVKLAAPYPPFPREIRAETDILVIPKTWEFIDGHF